MFISSDRRLYGVLMAARSRMADRKYTQETIWLTGSDLDLHTASDLWKGSDFWTGSALDLETGCDLKTSKNKQK